MQSWITADRRCRQLSQPELAVGIANIQNRACKAAYTLLLYHNNYLLVKPLYECGVGSLNEREQCTVADVGRYQWLVGLIDTAVPGG